MPNRYTLRDVVNISDAKNPRFVIVGPDEASHVQVAAQYVPAGYGYDAYWLCLPETEALVYDHFEIRDDHVGRKATRYQAERIMRREVRDMANNRWKS